jgi:hypothetical protein
MSDALIVALLLILLALAVANNLPADGGSGCYRKPKPPGMRKPPLPPPRPPRKRGE